MQFADAFPQFEGLLILIRCETATGAHTSICSKEDSVLCRKNRVVGKGTRIFLYPLVLVFQGCLSIIRISWLEIL